MSYTHYIEPGSVSYTLYVGCTVSPAFHCSRLVWVAGRGRTVLLQRRLHAPHAPVRRGEVAVRARDAHVPVPEREALHREHLALAPYLRCQAVVPHDERRQLYH